MNLELLSTIMSRDVVSEDSCIEIEFEVKSIPKYSSCYMGKMPDRMNQGKPVYWYGLVVDGSEAYDYSTFEEMLEDKVFDGLNLLEVFERVKWITLDGGEFYEMLSPFLNREYIRGKAK